MSIKRAYVDVDGRQLHYRVAAGSRGTPIVYLHQTASSSAMYEGLLAQLDGERPQYALDTPGFGQSDFPPPEPTVNSYAQALLTAAGALGLDRFHVLGHHTGASIACEMAAIAPDRIATLIMAGPPYLDAEACQEWLDETAAMVIDAKGGHLMPAWERAKDLGPKSSLDIVHRETVDTLRAGERWHEAYLAVFTYDMPARLALVRCPILMLCTHDDPLLPYFPHAREARPDARSVEMDGGVFVIDEAPEAIAGEVRTFLASVESS